MKPPIYNYIGKDYNATRRADPFIAERIVSHLRPKSNGIYLDAGCGTANYMCYLGKKGILFIGLDPSDTMLEVARVKCPNSTFIKGFAENIPVGNCYFDGVIAIFTLHHWENKQQGLNELCRIIKPGSRVIFLSFTASQMQGYWLRHYFPVMIKRSGELIPDKNAMFRMLYKAGFSVVETEKYFVQQGVQDHFLYSNKFKPEQYLNPEIRKGISSFSALSTPDELKRGLNQLEQDITTGRINTIINSYNNDKGDYMFYIAIR